MNERMLRLAHVLHMTSLCKSSFYKLREIHDISSWEIEGLRGVFYKEVDILALMNSFVRIERKPVVRKKKAAPKKKKKKKGE